MLYDYVLNWSDKKIESLYNGTYRHMPAMQSRNIGYNGN